MSKEYDKGWEACKIAEKIRIENIINNLRFKTKGAFPYWNDKDFKDFKKELKQKLFALK